MQAHKLTRLSLALLTVFSLNTGSIAAEPEKATIYDTDGSELVHFLVLPEGEKDSDGFVSTGIYPKNLIRHFAVYFPSTGILLAGRRGRLQLFPSFRTKIPKIWVMPLQVVMAKVI